MAFLASIGSNEAKGELDKLYKNSLETHGYIPNYTRAFSHRPGVMAAWVNLLTEIRNSIDDKRYELITLAAAKALQSSYCMLAHGSVLVSRFYDVDDVAQIAKDHHSAGLSDAEISMMDFAIKIVEDASSITQEDIDNLRNQGFSDEEIFDIAVTAAARCFFSKTLDALGVEPDSAYQQLDSKLKHQLTVGRSISPSDK